MSREKQFADRMKADATLMATLTGGVFTRGAIGLGGINRDSTPSAFDSSGWLRPCALVRQRGRVADDAIRDMQSQATSTVQVVEIYIYQDNAYDQIETAMNRIYALFQGHRFSDTADLYVANVIDRERDDGPQMGASMARIDFAVHSVWIAA